MNADNILKHSEWKLFDLAEFLISVYNLVPNNRILIKFLQATEGINLNDMTRGIIWHTVGLINLLLIMLPSTPTLEFKQCRSFYT